MWLLSFSAEELSLFLSFFLCLLSKERWIRPYFSVRAQHVWYVFSVSHFCPVFLVRCGNWRLHLNRMDPLYLGRWLLLLFGLLLLIVSPEKPRTQFPLCMNNSILQGFIYWRPYALIGKLPAMRDRLKRDAHWLISDQFLGSPVTPSEPFWTQNSSKCPFCVTCVFRVRFNCT